METTTPDQSTSHSTTTFAEGVLPTRVVVLGEDFVLADVLAMGVTPIAATATLNDTFAGIERDTTGIEPLSSTSPNLERLKSLGADLIIAAGFVADFLGEDVLNEIAPTAVLTAGDWRAALEDLGEALGAQQRAAELLAEYDGAVEEARAQIPSDLQATVATVYPGPTLAVWVDGPSNIPQTLIDLGITLQPGPGTFPDERFGRAYISSELIPSLSAPLLVLSQSDSVAGEMDALAEIQSSLIWQELPAVQRGASIVLDRLGYAGVEGRMRIIRDFVSALNPLAG